MVTVAFRKWTTNGSIQSELVFNLKHPDFDLAKPLMRILRRTSITRALHNSRGIALAIYGIIASLLTGTSAVASQDIVHIPGDILNFESFCAKQEPYSLQEYALLQSPDKKSQAVVAVSFTHRVGTKKDVIMYVSPQVIQLDLGPEYASRDTSLQLIMRKTETERIQSDSVGDYVSTREREEPNLETFRTDEAGKLNWISFVEPIKRGTGEHVHRILTRELFVVAPKHDGNIGISITAMVGADSVEMIGPTVRIPLELWENVPKSQIMGFAQAVNPFNEGSVWRFLFRASKYRKCIEERRFAKTFLTNPT